MCDNEAIRDLIREADRIEEALRRWDRWGESPASSFARLIEEAFRRGEEARAATLSAADVQRLNDEKPDELDEFLYRNPSRVLPASEFMHRHGLYIDNPYPYPRPDDSDRSST